MSAYLAQPLATDICQAIDHWLMLPAVLGQVVVMQT